MEPFLCQKCEQFFKDANDYFSVYTAAGGSLPSPPAYTKEHYNTISSFQAGAEEDCSLCSLFVKRFEGAPFYHIAGVRCTSLELAPGTESPWIVGLIVMFEDFEYVKLGDNGDDPGIELYPLSESRPPRAYVPLELSTGSSSAFQLMQVWLDDCLNLHYTCNSPNVSIETSPTRLLEVADGHLKLVKVSNLPKVPPYFTLSHCWGKIDILKLMQENFQSFESKINEEDLCQTFKDAVFITRKLNYQYIWIDSLCIIQDDEGDWRQEASKMSGVYGSSTLNLAASSAQDGSVGCFFERSMSTLRQLRRLYIKFGWASAKRFVGLDPKIYVKSMEQSLLSERGWAFQERFLAPRNLHFTNTQLYWECRETIASESHQDGLPKTLYHEHLERRKTQLSWSNVVHHYSSCKLTFPRDKLIALSGVAKWFHDHVGGDYVAGLWRSNLEQQLLWKTIDFPCTQRNTRNMPSWSWVGIDGTVWFEQIDNHAHQMVLSQVSDVDLTFAGGDPYGEVLFGRIRLCIGPLVGCMFERYSTDELGRSTKTTLFNGAHAGCIVWEDVGPSRLHKARWYFLPIIATQEHTQNSDSKQVDFPFMKDFRGIMLESIPGPVSGYFRRVAYFQSNKNFSSAMKDPECWADESLYEGRANVDKYRRQNYYITII